MLESTRESGPTVGLVIVQEMQRRFRVHFPPSYVNFLLTYNGGRPNPPNFFPVANGRTTWMRIHFLFGINHTVKTCDLVWNFEMYRSRLPELVIPIASDEGGNRFCLDLRVDDICPVLFWDHEEETLGRRDAALKLVIASSFDEWMHMLTHDV